MDPVRYVEFETDLQTAAFAEWLGRCWAADMGKPYPIPPDAWTGPPDEPPPEVYERYWLAAKPKAGGGGVFTLDDDTMRFAPPTAVQTLSDGHDYATNIQAIWKLWAELSPQAQAALTPPPPPWL